MSLRDLFGRSRRRRGVWLSIVWTITGTVLVTALVAWIEIHRETDLADPSAGLTARSLHAGGSDAPPIRFEEVAGDLGVSMHHGPGPRGRTLPEDTGSGLAWGDIDGDGDWDLYCVNIPGPLGTPPGPESSNRLFRNEGGERFTDITESAGVGDSGGFGMGATFADYDDDGHVDLHVTNFGPNRLYRNRGDGTFEEVSTRAGVADSAWSTGATWGDFDRDGHVDVYVCNYVDYDAELAGADADLETSMGSLGVPFTLNPNSFDPQPNRLYRNRGDGTFEDVAPLLGVDNPDGRSLAAAFCDLDGDGWLDLYVNNDVSTNRLYRNLGAPPTPTGPAGPARDPTVTFLDVSTVTGTADPRGSMGLSIGDLAGEAGPDGVPDLFITHWVAQENALYQGLLSGAGSLEYRDKTRATLLGEISIQTVGWGTAIADLDLDGLPDLVTVNGSTLERRDDPGQLADEPIFLFWNEGDRFRDVAPQAGPALSARHGSRGLASADFDGDGDVDLAVAINRGQPLILRNVTETPHRSLTVRLRARAATCFGARVEVVAGGARQTRWWGSDVSYLAMHAPELVFGLGENDRATSVTVLWADGRRSSREDVPAGRVEIAAGDAVGGLTRTESARPQGPGSPFTSIPVDG